MGLSQQAYSVDAVFNGLKALELIEINSYDLVILVLNLPEIDGLEICRRDGIADSRPGILILTARAGQDDRVTGLTSEAVYLLLYFTINASALLSNYLIQSFNNLSQFFLRYFTGKLTHSFYGKCANLADFSPGASG